jgi:hypothetical protein
MDEASAEAAIAEGKAKKMAGACQETLNRALAAGMEREAEPADVSPEDNPARPRRRGRPPKDTYMRSDLTASGKK